jgi:hypothetical protein
MIDPPFCVRLPASIQASMRHQAQIEGRSLGEVVNDAFREYVEAQGTPSSATEPVRMRAGRRKRMPWPEGDLVIVDD